MGSLVGIAFQRPQQRVHARRRGCRAGRRCRRVRDGRWRRRARCTAHFAQWHVRRRVQFLLPTRPSRPQLEVLQAEAVSTICMRFRWWRMSQSSKHGLEMARIDPAPLGERHCRGEVGVVLGPLQPSETSAASTSGSALRSTANRTSVSGTPCSGRSSMFSATLPATCGKLSQAVEVVGLRVAPFGEDDDGTQLRTFGDNSFEGTTPSLDASSSSISRSVRVRAGTPPGRSAAGLRTDRACRRLQVARFTDPFAGELGQRAQPGRAVGAFLGPTTLRRG